jgi:hypothetical protein
VCLLCRVSIKGEQFNSKKHSKELVPEAHEKRPKPMTKLCRRLSSKEAIQANDAVSAVIECRMIERTNEMSEEEDRRDNNGLCVCLSVCLSVCPSDE